MQLIVHLGFQALVIITQSPCIYVGQSHAFVTGGLDSVLLLECRRSRLVTRFGRLTVFLLEVFGLQITHRRSCIQLRLQNK